MGAGHRTVSVQTLHSLAEETGDGTTTSFSIKTCRTVEIWLRATAISAGTLTMNIQTSPDGVNFDTIDSTVTLAATGANQISLDRENFALGVAIQVNFTLGGGTDTFEILLVKAEY